MWPFTPDLGDEPDQPTELRKEEQRQARGIDDEAPTPPTTRCGKVVTGQGRCDRPPDHEGLCHA